MAGVGYRVTGTCGALPARVVRNDVGRVIEELPAERSTCRARFGANEIVTAKCFSARACDDFRAKVTSMFGPGGARVIFGHGSRAPSEAELLEQRYVPEELQAPEDAAMNEGPAGRLVAGLRSMFSSRPSGALQEYAASLERDAQEARARAAAEETEKRRPVKLRDDD